MPDNKRNEIAGIGIGTVVVVGVVLWIAVRSLAPTTGGGGGGGRRGGASEPSTPEISQDTPSIRNVGTPSVGSRPEDPSEAADIAAVEHSKRRRESGGSGRGDVQDSRTFEKPGPLRTSPGAGTTGPTGSTDPEGGDVRLQTIADEQREDRTGTTGPTGSTDPEGGDVRLQSAANQRQLSDSESQAEDSSPGTTSPQTSIDDEFKRRQFRQTEGF